MNNSSTLKTNQIQIVLMDGTSEYHNGMYVTTHEHTGVQPCEESLRKVIKNRDGYIAIVEEAGYPRSNIIKRYLSDEITDIRRSGRTVM